MTTQPPATEPILGDICPRYKLDLSDSFLYSGDKLYRLVALKDFADVKAGDLGGYMHESSILEEEGTSWVYPGAVVGRGCALFGHSVVHDSQGSERKIRDYARPATYLTNTELYHYARVKDSEVDSCRIQGVCEVSHSEIRACDISGGAILEQCRLNAIEINDYNKYYNAAVWGPISRNFYAKTYGATMGGFQITARQSQPNIPETFRDYLSHGFHAINEAVASVAALTETLLPTVTGMTIKST